ncbi:hypothetical protein TPB0596_46150 [Tsukamurella pulmonis]|uniref:TIGR03083 family protein n=1 Tax=Tsukamurella pulmonis TaxID=47312 RepID=A0A1H1AKK0_9ACTN|nr:maleylpyruvate isomerase family mycothiol-dependent enzyme [Tsukamurella pulmonis]KXO96097.1 DinB family protein [Tsukamurella pulmonis]BDD84852.1 hypothetical protein TPB0596_46150 [Tsukamurella pulmonis]SDQ40011.1 TIGR03083 family protein [Tsukamurella pulmonis]SUP26517.1 uncharacterized Actinobacterial protein [Tsukamurella pulmonis]
MIGSVRELALAERASLLELIETLTPDQWATPSLCEGWTVRDVVAHHFSYDMLTAGQTARRIITGLRHPGGPNALGIEYLADQSTDELVETVRRHLDPRGIVTAFGCRVALTDGMHHQQDVRRPLGLPRSIPEERLRPALDFSLWAPPIRGVVHGRGVRLIADDLDWAFGRGPEVRGPGEAVLMALGGRSHALRDLTGPGWDRLARNLGHAAA